MQRRNVIVLVGSKFVHPVDYQRMAVLSSAWGPNKRMCNRSSLLHASRPVERKSERCEIFTVQGAPHGIGSWEKNPEWQGYKVKMAEWLKQTLR